MDVHDYVVNQLSTYRQACQNIQTLKFELRALTSLSTENTDSLIESMTFSHSSEEPVKSGQLSDKTASIALNYRTVNMEQVRSAKREIVLQLGYYQLRVSRLEAYLDALPQDEADILRCFYFNQMTWSEISQSSHICIRTIMRCRDRAIKRLVEFYTRLAAIGMLPELDESRGDSI